MNKWDYLIEADDRLQRIYRDFTSKGGHTWQEVWDVMEQFRRVDDDRWLGIYRQQFIKELTEVVDATRHSVIQTVNGKWSRGRRIYEVSVQYLEGPRYMWSIAIHVCRRQITPHTFWGRAADGVTFTIRRDGAYSEVRGTSSPTTWRPLTYLNSHPSHILNNMAVIVDIQ